MDSNNESDVICRLPTCADLSLQQVLALDRKVLADVIREKIEEAEHPERKVARFQSSVAAFQNVLPG
jgi:hypothetical protein